MQGTFDGIVCGRDCSGGRSSIFGGRQLLFWKYSMTSTAARHFRHHIRRCVARPVVHQRIYTRQYANNVPSKSRRNTSSGMGGIFETFLQPANGLVVAMRLWYRNIWLTSYYVTRASNMAVTEPLPEQLDMLRVKGTSLWRCQFGTSHANIHTKMSCRTTNY